MIALQRHREILHRIAAEGAVRVPVLADELEVTDETIRRDLRLLSEQGLLERTHGGAVAVQRDDHVDLTYDQRQATNPLEKSAIARAAVALIEPGQVVALDPSSTACRLARLIPDQPLTVVTNSLIICSILASRSQIEVICTGGTLDSEAMAFFGLPAQRALEQLNVEHLFFSCRGVDLERGLSEANDRHAAVKLSMIEASRRRTLLIDSSKLGIASTVFYAPIDVVQQVVVDRPADAAAGDAVTRLRERGLNIDEADVLEETHQRA